VYFFTVTANVVPSSLILVTLMMEALVLTRATWHNIPEDGFLHRKHNVLETGSLAILR
jgi:hypothetical protein